MCDKAVLMQQGRVLATGDAEEVLRMYRELKAADLG